MTITPSFDSKPSFPRGAVQGLFALIVAAAETGAAVPSDSIDLINEDDAGGVLFFAWFK
jgi:hypothetical protein